MNIIIIRCLFKNFIIIIFTNKIVQIKTNIKNYDIKFENVKKR